jgi:hypothetical protein
LALFNRKHTLIRDIRDVAKAKYHKAQRVFVKPVGTWAHVEQILPKWVNGVEEPIRVHYDVGMGREFTQEELVPANDAMFEGEDDHSLTEEGQVAWRVTRGTNKWKTKEECGHHPYPGTHPVIVTTERDWGGWRVPGAEYDRNPELIEQQARMMVKAPMMAAVLYQFIDDISEQEENLPESTVQIARLAKKVLDGVD